MSQLYFFRHAQASYMADDYDQLSPQGEMQSAELGKYLLEKNIRFDKIFTGPLKRQKHTFEIVGEVYGQKGQAIPKPILLEELREHAGPAALRKAYPEMLKTVPQVQQWQEEIQQNPALKKRNTLLALQYFMEEWSVGNIDVADVQSWAAFRIKVKKGLMHLLEHTAKGETVGVFTSGGTISAITAEALNIQDEKRVAAMNFSVRNTSFSTFLFSQNQFNLLSFNEIPHLQKEMITFV